MQERRAELERQAEELRDAIEVTQQGWDREVQRGNIALVELEAEASRCAFQAEDKEIEGGRRRER